MMSQPNSIAPVQSINAVTFAEFLRWLADFLSNNASLQPLCEYRYLIIDDGHVPVQPRTESPLPELIDLSNNASLQPLCEYRYLIIDDGHVPVQEQPRTESPLPELIDPDEY